jgi:type 1 glutamine amidotransferase
MKPVIVTLLIGAAVAAMGMVVLTAPLGSAAWAQEGAQAVKSDEPIRTLLVTGGPIHDGKAIGDIVEKVLEKTGRFDVTRVHEDLNAFLPDRIAPYDLVMFYWTLGEITEAQKRGLMNHIASGKGYVTWHSGADSFRGDPDYRALVGGWFVTHPHYRTYQVSVTENDSPITKGIDEFMITDEQYILDYNSQVNVLANGLYKGKTMPVMWTKPWGDGRVFYCALGHDPKACEQEMFQKLIVRGAEWAAGREVTE